MNEDHINIRETLLWGTYGKTGTEPLRHVLVKNITDDHLENLIPYLQRNWAYYPMNIVDVMIDEQEYRKIRKIRIPFKFG